MEKEPGFVAAPEAATVLRTASAPRRQGEVVGKLAQSLFFVHQDDEVGALADAMDREPALFAVGVVDGQNAPVGMVLRRELFDLLGKQYGREFYKKKPISAVMESSRIFPDALSILSAAELLKEEVRRLEDTYYLMVDPAGKFSGVLSTRNILIYLSEATARDIALARRLQSAMVQESRRYEEPPVVVACSSRMAREVGGDFYLVKRLSPGRLLTAVCDVSGKGIAASLVTAVLGGILHTYEGAGGLAPMLRGLNRYLYDTFRLEYFVTGIFMELDLATGESVACDLGHSYGLVRRDGRLRHIGKSASNPPLGIVASLEPALAMHRLLPGDLVLLFTDGVVEQTDPRGVEYSERRLWGLLKGEPRLTPEELQAALCRDIDAFRGTQPQHDDLTFAALKYG